MNTVLMFVQQLLCLTFVIILDNSVYILLVFIIIINGKSDKYQQIAFGSNEKKWRVFNHSIKNIVLNLSLLNS